MNALAQSDTALATKLILIVSLWVLAWGCLGYAAGMSRGRGDAGALLGVFLGPLGVLVALLLPANPGWQPPAHRSRRTSPYDNTRVPDDEAFRRWREGH